MLVNQALLEQDLVKLRHADLILPKWVCLNPIVLDPKRLTRLISLMEHQHPPRFLFASVLEMGLVVVFVAEILTTGTRGD